MNKILSITKSINKAAVVVLLAVLSTFSFATVAQADYFATTTATTSGTFIVPAGVTSLTVSLTAGGAGGGGGAFTYGGGGGGAGSSISNIIIPVTPGQTIPYTVGLGGVGGSAGSYSTAAGNGANGGNSSFGITTVSGGFGGQGAIYSLGNGLGGFAGGAGGTNGTDGASQYGPDRTYGGNGGTTPFGIGGQGSFGKSGSYTAPTAGTNGNGGGAGSGWAYDANGFADNGAKGGNGIITVSYFADLTAPVITLNGSSTITIAANSVYTELGATAYDANYGTTSVVISGLVSTSATGTYSVLYTATDLAGNVATATRSVIVTDQTAPVITAPATQTFEATGTSTTPALIPATAVDNIDPSPAITYNPTSFALGTTTVVWTATDGSGNFSTTTSLVVIKDTTAPAIVLNGSNPMSVMAGSTFVDPGAVATDLVDGTTTVTVSGSVNANVVGTYFLIYSSTDLSGNTSNVFRTVNVSLAPAALTAINFLPGGTAISSSTVYYTPVVITLGDTGLFIATTTDQYGNTFATTTTWSSSNTTVGTIDPVTGVFTSLSLGTTTVTATAGSLSTSTLVTVAPVPVVTSLSVTSGPDGTVVTINGSGFISIDEAGWLGDGITTFADSGFIPTSISASGTQMTFTITGNWPLGNYYVYILRPGSMGSNPTFLFNLTASDVTAPVITILGSNPLTLTSSSTGVYADAGATAFDAFDNATTTVITASNNVNLAATGTYSVVYTSADVAGNIATSTRTVNVVAPAPSVLTSISIAPVTPFVLVGTSTQFTVTTLDQYGNPMAASPIIWLSSNTAAGTIAPFTGLFSGLSNGTTSVTVFAGSLSTSTTVTVSNIPPALTTVILSNVNPLPLTLTVGATTTFVATTLDQYGNPFATTTNFVSSDAVVGTIDPVTGLFSALSVGTTTVTLTAGSLPPVTTVVTVVPVVNLSVFITNSLINSIYYASVSTTSGAIAGLTGTTTINSSTVNSSSIDNSSVSTSTIINSTISFCTVLDSTVINFTGTHCFIDPTTMLDTYGTGNSGNYASSTGTTTINSVNFDYSWIDNSTVIHTTINYSSTTFAYIKDATVMGSVVNNSTTTNSTVSTSTLNNVAVDNSNILFSSIASSTVDASTIDSSTVTWSQVATSTISNGSVVDQSSVMVSTVDNSQLLNNTRTRGSNIVNSVLDSATLTFSTSTGSTLVNTTATNTVITNSSSTNSVIDNSVITNSTLASSTVSSSTLTNVVDNGSSIIGTVLSNATTTNAVINNGYISAGFITIGGITYGPFSTSTLISSLSGTDTIAPVITITGANPANVTVGGSYVDAGATAFDAFDATSTTVSATGTVDTLTVGVYTITYTSSDLAGNIATSSRTVNVNPVVTPDTTAPVITILGSNPVTVVATSTGSYTDAGATSTDNIDGNLTSFIVTTNTVNVSVVGTYTVTYAVSDFSGNGATSTRTVNVVATLDTVAPVITLNGSNPVNITVGSSYTDAGATATDNIDGNITANIITSGLPINTSATGTQIVTYSVTDGAGNSTSTTRTVNVIATPVDTIPPVITMNGGSPLTIALGSGYSDLGATAFDAVDGTTTVSTVNNVNTSATGTYTVDYSSTDVAGNTATTSRTVNVIAAPADTIAPVISITGGTPLTFAATTTVVYTDAGATYTDNVDGGPFAATTTSNNVDLTIIGAYTVVYSAQDVAGNISTATRDVNVIAGSSTADVIPPVITITGGTPVTITAGSAYVDQGATANDAVDGSVAATILSNNVNNTVVGTYQVIYTASDLSGNTATATRNVNVIAAPLDTIPPVITMNGGSPLTIALGSVYSDLGATAFDAVDGTTTVSTVNNVNTSATGTYTVDYSSTDVAGNTATTSRVVNVVLDTVAPVITVLGSNPMTIVLTLPYTEAGATSIDNIDGNISAGIVITGSVNVNATGTYTIVYTSTDGSGNVASSSRTVNVIADNVAPVITITGANPVNINVGTSYVDAGATALDNVDGGVAVSSTSTVNTAIAGTYSVDYSAIDSSGNVATASRVVNVNVVVVDTVAPVITITGANPITVLVGSSYTDAGATALDAVDGVRPVTSTSTVNTTVAGAYSVIYSSTDVAGNTATSTRVVNVVATADTTAPLITITGANPVTVTLNGTYTDAGATATDNVDGNITSNITTVSTVNVSVVGSYFVKYTVADGAGNIASSTRIVNVVPAVVVVVIPSIQSGGGGAPLVPEPTPSLTTTPATPVATSTTPVVPVTPATTPVVPVTPATPTNSGNSNGSLENGITIPSGVGSINTGSGKEVSSTTGTSSEVASASSTVRRIGLFGTVAGAISNMSNKLVISLAILVAAAIAGLLIYRRKDEENSAEAFVSNAPTNLPTGENVIDDTLDR